MTHLLRLLPVLLCAALAGCGGSSGGDPGADPAEVVPAGAPVYLEAQLDPSGELESDVRALSQKLAGTGDPGAEIKKLIEKEARESDKDFSFEEDVESWLGDRVAIFVTNVSAKPTSPGDSTADAAAVFPTSDPDKAREFGESQLASRDPDEKAPRVVERKHRDVSYKLEQNEDTAFAMIDDYAVIGDEAGIKAAIDAKEGDSLADAEAFKQTRDQVPDDGLAFAYFGLRQFFSSLGPQAAALRPLLGGVGDTVGVGLDVDADAIRFDAATKGVTSPEGKGPGTVLPTLPGDAFLALGVSDIGGTITRALEQFGQLGALGGVDIREQLRTQLGIDVERDIASWMGDAGVFVSGSTVADLGGGLVVEVKDKARAVAAIPKLARLAASAGDLKVSRLPGVEGGYRLRSDAIPLPIDVGVVGEKFILAVGGDAFKQAADPDAPLSDTPAFKTAGQQLGDGFSPALFVNMEPVLGLVGTLGLDETGEVEKRVLRALGSLTTIVAGGQREGDIARYRLVVGVK